MADPRADIIRNNGTDVSQNPQALDFTTGLEVTESNGVATVKVKDLGVDTDQLAADAVTGAKIEDDAISLEHLDAAITPSHIVVFAGQHTTAGGDTAEQASVAGVVATDIVICSLESNGTNDSTLISGAAGTDVIDFVLNEDPGTDVIINYMVLRAAA